MADENGKMETSPEIFPTTPGRYSLRYKSAGGGGTGLVEFSADGETDFVALTDGAFTTTDDKIAELPAGAIRVTRTGDAEVWIRKIRQ